MGILFISTLKVGINSYYQINQTRKHQKLKEIRKSDIRTHNLSSSLTRKLLSSSFATVANGGASGGCGGSGGGSAGGWQEATSTLYTSLNFNGIFEKKLSNTNQSSATDSPSSAKSLSNQSKTILSNPRIHGHMLVLTRPAPKRVSIPQKSEIKEQDPTASPPPHSLPSDPIKVGSEPDSISLRPKGRTGSTSVLSSSALPSPVSPLSSKFVPPHLRSGFAGKEEKPGSELLKGGFKAKPDFRGQRPGNQFHDPGNYAPGAIEGRPKSGGGYDPIRRDHQLSDLNRPVSSGALPSSSGWCILRRLNSFIDKLKSNL